MVGRTLRFAGRGRSLAIAALFFAGLASGCMPASCETEPFGAVVVAAARTPSVPPAGLGIAACNRLVTFDGADYSITGLELRIPDASLTEIGQASGANRAAGAIADHRVFRVDGVDPTDAIAIRLGADADLVLLVREGRQMPDGACRFLAERVDACIAPSPAV